MAVIDGSFRIKSIEFLKDLPNLEYVDLANTSYKGDISLLDSELIGTDQQTVSVLPCNRNSFTILGYPYSKDDAVIFYVEKMLAGAHSATFKVLGNGYAKDQQAVYFKSKKMPGVDAGSFKLFTGGEHLEEFHFAKDKSSVYIDDKIIEGADVASFERVSLGYGKDSKQVFFKNRVVKNARVASFKTYEHRFRKEDAEDTDNKYLAGKRVSANRQGE